MAETRALAEDACELVDVDIEPLATVSTVAEALDPARPPLFDAVGTNVLCRRAATYGDVEGAFERADRVVTARFEQQRMANVPLEGRACIARFDTRSGALEIDVAHQNPHALRAALAAILEHPVEQVTVRCGDIGGSFGQKAYTSREEACVCAAARLLGRAVKWVEDRSENLLAAGHARDDTLDVQMAVDADGVILGARVSMTVNQGAYQVATVPSSIYLDLVRVLFPNAYRIPNFAFDGTVVATNTATYIAFRGPWESETWVRERMLDLVAREVGLEPAEVRRRNLITIGEQPVTMATGPTIDHMTARETLDRGVRARRDPRVPCRAGGGAPPREIPRLRPGHLRRGRARTARLQRGVGRGCDRAVGPAGAGPLGGRRHRHGVHEPAAARAGPRDHAGPARRRRPAHRARPGARRAR